MKKIAMILVVLVALSGVAVAGLDTYDSITVKTLAAPVTVTGSQSNAVVDVAGAKGTCNLLLDIGPAVTNAANFTCTATLKTCATSAGTYYTVTNMTGNACALTSTNHSGTGSATSIKVEAAVLKRYVKLYYTAANDTCVVAGKLLYMK